MKPSPHLTEIMRLDPVRDHLRIVHLDVSYEFPFDTTRALELAFFRTFAVPSIARLLDTTGEFRERPQRRYDDTDLIVSAIAEHGYESPEGMRALRRMNGIHARFKIANEDFLYVLSTFVLEPVRWNRRFGWRPLVEAEWLAAFHFWREVGRRMAIREIPGSYGELERFNVEYERANFRWTPAGERVASSMAAMFASWFPGLPKRLGRAGIAAVLDEPLREAVGFPRPPAALRRAAEASLRARSRAVRILPPRRQPRLRTRIRRRSYPDGYRLEELGPPTSSTRRSA